MLELQHVSYSAPVEGGVKEIIKDVSLTINEKFVAFTGPNGGGKSTLAKLIMGLYRPTEGKIFFDGVDITDMSVTDRAKLGIGYAFQNPVKFKGITVSDLINIAAGKRLSVADVCNYLSEVGLCARDYVNREINASLSGGELKRIEIAVALVRGCRLTVFDEPEAGIDLWSFGNLIGVFEKMNARIDGSILIISHQERILRIADRIIVLSGGSVVKDGTADELEGVLSDGFCNTLKNKI